MSRLVCRLFPSNGSSAVYRTPSRSVTLDTFRISLGLQDRPNKTRELQEHKDFTFNDGRPTPVTPGQLKKIKRQRELAAQAVQHLKEIKFIENRFNNEIQRKQNECRLAIENKLKPKGDELLKKSKAS